MTLNRDFIERNRAASKRIRDMANLSDAALRTPVGEHWTVAVLLAHLALWDLRVMFVLDKTQQEGKLFPHQSDNDINDISLPLLKAIPPQEAVRLAMETAEALDTRLEAYPPDLLEEVFTYNQRWVDRSLHRNDHLDEAQAALTRRG